MGTKKMSIKRKPSTLEQDNNKNDLRASQAGELHLLKVFEKLAPRYHVPEWQPAGEFVPQDSGNSTQPCLHSETCIAKQQEAWIWL